MRKFRKYSLFVGQQGGIGYPPVVVKVGKKVYAIGDSRYKKEPHDLIPFEKPLPSLFAKKRTEFRTQAWVLKQWQTAKVITWDILRQILTKKV